MEQMLCKWHSLCSQLVGFMKRFNLTNLMLLVYFWQLFVMTWDMMDSQMAIILIRLQEEPLTAMMYRCKRASMLLSFLEYWRTKKLTSCVIFQKSNSRCWEKELSDLSWLQICKDIWQTEDLLSLYVNQMKFKMVRTLVNFSTLMIKFKIIPTSNLF